MFSKKFENEASFKKLLIVFFFFSINKSTISQRHLKLVFRHFLFLKWASHIFLLCGNF
jgi:hypothetical protein